MRSHHEQARGRHDGEQLEVDHVSERHGRIPSFREAMKVMIPNKRGAIVNIALMLLTSPSRRSPLNIIKGPACTVNANACA